MYVEDELFVLEELGEVFKNIFPNTVLAKDADEAMKKFNHSIDLVITDLILPNKNGICLIEQMKQIKSDIHILVISGSNEPKYLSKLIEFGVNGYLLKPVSFDALLNQIIAIVNKIVEKRENKKYLITLQNELDEKALQVQQKYYLDEVTGLRNRNSLLKDIKRFKPELLILIDINKFSVINDLYGNKAGDDVLRAVTKKLVNINIHGGLYKISADQFVFIKLTESSYYSCDTFVKLIQKAINETTINLNVNSLPVEIFISVTISASNLVEVEKLFESADLALHYAKKTNQNFVIYSDEIDKKINSKKTFDAIKLVKNAFERDAVVPFFQPIIKDYERSYECLVRIIDEEGKVISPYSFLDEIKGTSYYVNLTKTMIGKSFDYFSDKQCSFSINLSFEDISNGDIIEYLKMHLDKYQIASRFILEILESESIDNFKIVKDFISEMKSYGVRIAIDDFGSGYSNFSYLLELDPDYIKIDGSIMKNIATDEKSYTITKTIVKFSKELGIKTVGEFISTKEVYEIAQELGVEGKQGYYLGEPRIDI
jgi:diguanylate cyclase (GGDEF)-like protein